MVNASMKVSPLIASMLIALTYFQVLHRLICFMVCTPQTFRSMDIHLAVMDSTTAIVSFAVTMGSHQHSVVTTPEKGITGS